MDSIGALPYAIEDSVCQSRFSLCKVTSGLHLNLFHQAPQCHVVAISLLKRSKLSLKECAITLGISWRHGHCLYPDWRASLIVVDDFVAFDLYIRLADLVYVAIINVNGQP